MITAIALDARDTAGVVQPGGIALLTTPDAQYQAITNNDGYALWPRIPVPFAGILQLAGTIAPYGPGGNGYAVTIPANVQNVTIRVGPQQGNPQDVHLPGCTPQSFKPPFRQAPRFWVGNMCGTRVTGLPAVPGGAADPSLVLSWFIDRYSPSDRQRVYAAWKAKSLTHTLVSWPDAEQFGHTPQQFRDTCVELVKSGFYPAVFLSAKPTSSADIRTVEETIANINLVLPLLVGIVPVFCIGWELSLWLSPTDVQTITDAIAPICLQKAGTRVYVHFQERYMGFQQPGGIIADYWNANIGKLTGVLLQRQLGSTDHDYLDWLNDCLERAAGNDGMPATIIDGHGVDLVALELDAQDQFNGTAGEDEGIRLGKLAIQAPPRNGPAGLTSVQGAGNG